MSSQTAHDRYASHLADNEHDRQVQLMGHAEVRRAFADLETTLNEVLPDGRYKILTVTALEEAAMWANKSVASPYPIHPDHTDDSEVGTQGSGVDSPFRII